MDESPTHRPIRFRDYLPFWILFSAVMGSEIASRLSPTAKWVSKTQGSLWGAAAGVIVTLVAGTICYPIARRFQMPHSVLLVTPAIPAFQADVRIHSLAEGHRDGSPRRRHRGDGVYPQLSGRPEQITF